MHNKNECFYCFGLGPVGSRGPGASPKAIREPPVGRGPHGGPRDLAQTKAKNLLGWAGHLPDHSAYLAERPPTIKNATGVPPRTT